MSLLQHKLEDILKNPQYHSQYLEDITNLGALNTCKNYDPCLVGEGSYALAYKTCPPRSKECFLLKIKHKNRSFDVNEYRINEEGYKHLRSKKLILIAQPRGILGDLSDPSAFVYVFEEGSQTLRSFLETVRYSHSEFKTIIFQIVLCLKTLQNTVPGFTHNDLHTENVLVLRQPSVVQNKSMKMKCKYSIRIIDFGQSSTNALQTQDAIKMWLNTSGNTMVDFLKLANWVLMDLYITYHKTRNNQVRLCIANFLLLLSNYVSHDCVKNGSSVTTKTGKFLSLPWLCLNQDGERYINSLYSPRHKNAMELILSDSYFK